MIIRGPQVMKGYWNRAGETAEAIKDGWLYTGDIATGQEIIDFCTTRLAKYKLPTIIEFRAELPKTNVGKILRKVLKEEEKQKMKN